MKELTDFPEWRKFTEANDRFTELVEKDPDFARIFQEAVIAEWDRDEEKAASYFKEVEDRGIPIGEIIKAQMDSADAVFSNPELVNVLIEKTYQNKDSESYQMFRLLVPRMAEDVPDSEGVRGMVRLNAMIDGQ